MALRKESRSVREYASACAGEGERSLQQCILQVRHQIAQRWRQGPTAPFCCSCTARLPRKRLPCSCQLIRLGRRLLR